MEHHALSKTVISRRVHTMFLMFHHKEQISKPLAQSLYMNNNPRPIVLGSYSPSQNGIIVSPHGIALCIAGGGKGHDVDKPKILIEYD